MQRSTATVLAVFLLLSLVTLFSFVFFPPHGTAAFKKRSLVPAEAKTATSRIVLSGSGADVPVILEKKDGRWFFLLGKNARYPARDGHIRAFLDDLAAPRRIVNKRTTDGSGAPVALRLEDPNGNVIAELEFGSANADGQSRLVRTGSGTTFMEADDSFSPWLDGAARDWTELSVFREALALSDIQEVSCMSGTAARRFFVRGKNGEVEMLSDILEPLRALDITNIPSAPGQTVSLGMGSGETITFTLAPLGEDLAILALPVTGAAYVISASARDGIVGTLGLR